MPKSKAEGIGLSFTFNKNHSPLAIPSLLNILEIDITEGY